jgi:HEAT repeat protein
MTHLVTRRLQLLAIILGILRPCWAQEFRRSTDPPARQLAIRGAHISNDQWPDAFTLRTFAGDAIRLEKARTEEEQALALYNWIARVMTVGGSPYEGEPGKEAPVLDTVKIMAIYGNHWCDGQARLLETMWRSLGRQGVRLFIPMRVHSFVELRWRDTDGQERWHALDVNNGWFVRNHQGWIASSEDIERDPLLVLAANQDLKMRTKGWLRTHLSVMPEHSMALHLRQGEVQTLSWDNESTYYVNPRTRATVSADSPLFTPGGPFSEFIGAGEMVFEPDFRRPGWIDDLKQAPDNIMAVDGRLQPKANGRDSSVIYQFDFPYLISDARVEALIVNRNAEASTAVSFSIDNGLSWHRAWASSAVGETRLKVNLGVDRNKAAQPSVLGRYSYLLRIEFHAQSNPGAISLGGLKFTHRTMLNKMTLPNLQPGWNHFRVAAQSMAPESGLLVRLDWTDKNGRQIIEKNLARLPAEFDVFANCSGGAGIKMHSIQLRAIPSADASRPLEISNLRKIIEAGLVKDARAVAGLMESLKEEDPEIRYWAADALGKIGSAAAVPALIAALRDPLDAVRMSACVALGDLKAREALPVLVDLMTGRIPSGKGYSLFIPQDVGAVQWMAARALGRIGDPGAVEPLMNALEKSGGDLGVYIAEALGDLGDRRAVPGLVEAAKKGDEPALRSVAEALGRIGDPAAVQVLIELLNSGKEDARFASIIALGRIRDPRGIAALKRTSEVDPQLFVREAAARILEEISK